MLTTERRRPSRNSISVRWPSRLTNSAIRSLSDGCGCSTAELSRSTVVDSARIARLTVAEDPRPLGVERSDAKAVEKPGNELVGSTRIRHSDVQRERAEGRLAADVDLDLCTWKGDETPRRV